MEVACDFDYFYQVNFKWLEATVLKAKEKIVQNKKFWHF